MLLALGSIPIKDRWASDDTQAMITVEQSKQNPLFFRLTYEDRNWRMTTSQFGVGLDSPYELAYGIARPIIDRSGKGRIPSFETQARIWGALQTKIDELFAQELSALDDE